MARDLAVLPATLVSRISVCGVLTTAALLLLSPLSYGAMTSSQGRELPLHTLAFIAASLITTVYFAHVRFDRFAVAHGPEVLTTFGIFGCFFGISLGLWDFNTANISESVPRLLEGIRTAFWASLTGIGGALYIKFRHTFRREPIPQAPGSGAVATMDDLVAVTTKMQRSIAEGDEGSLLGQMKLLRQDQNDGLRSLAESFRSFAQTMAEQNSKALIEALNEVIRDFNTKLNEQFGENFKQLNQAVEKLVLWQQQYKEELGLLKLSQEQAASDMRVATDAFSVVLRNAENFSGTAERLSAVIVALGEELESNAEAQKSLHEALSKMKEVAPQFAVASGRLVDDLRASVIRTNGEFEAIAKAAITSTQSSTSEMRRLMQETMADAQKQFQASVQRTMDDAKERVTKLDEALGKELTRALESLGQQLTALSRKFVEDYTPLTDKLRDVVRVAQRV